MATPYAYGHHVVLEPREPGPDRAWMSDAACTGLATRMFFPERGEDSRTARAVCAGCPVRVECADYGYDEHFGIWGGLSERQRRIGRRPRLVPTLRATAS